MELSGTPSSCRLPPPLSPGARVGVAAISGPIRQPERLAAGLDALRRLGFEPVEAANLRSRTADDLFAGGDDERLDAFHELAADPDLEAVFFARGGHGVLRLLPRIDWELLARHPRAYVGYSDLTPFLLAVVERLDLVAFHGPMVAADLARGLDDGERESLLGALGGRFPTAVDVDAAPGAARRGRLLGGCLSLLAATLGTPWAPRLDGAVLFVEELDEPLYRFDRLLTHLRLSGNLANVEGLVTGHLNRMGQPPRCRELLGELAAELGAVFAWGLEAGHASPNLTLPLGMEVELDPARGRLVLGPGSFEPLP